MNFVNQAMNAYSQSQHSGQQNPGNNQAGDDFGVTGGSRFNQSANSSGGLGGMLGQFLDNDDDKEDVVATADNDSGSSGDRGLFGQAMNFLKSGNADVNSDVDEQGVVNAHQQAYSQGNGNQMDASSMGAAAALQALKKFTGAGGEQQPAAAAGGGQTKLIGLAMSEASKLFDQSGGAANGGKQDVVNSAAQTIMKFVLKSQMSGMMGTGGGAAGGGGMGNLLSMAAKFM